MKHYSIDKLVKAADSIKDIVLSNVVMIGEVPARTFMEEARIGMLLERFSECGLQRCSSDKSMNGFGVLHGKEGRKSILVASNADTLAEDESEPAVSISKDSVKGPFVGDNSIALAAMASLPVLFEKIGWRPTNNIVFMGVSRMLGRGNLSGLTTYLDAPAMKPAFGICVDSFQLGRLNYACLGMLVGDIVTRVPDTYNWVQFGATGSIIPMSDIISRINAIPVPRRPLTSIVLGAIHGGFSHRNIATKTRLSFQVRSESREMLSEIDAQLHDICEDVGGKSGVRVELDMFSRSEPGGLDISHPLVRRGKEIHQALGIDSMLYPTTFALSAFIKKKIPAVCLGFTTSHRTSRCSETEELADIEPMTRGLAQLAAMIMEIDGGGCGK